MRVPPMLRQTHFFGRARRVRRRARAKPDRVHKIWAARADQFYPSRFLPGTSTTMLSYRLAPVLAVVFVRFPESENASPRWNHERCYAASRFDCCRHGLGRIWNYLAGFGV